MTNLVPCIDCSQLLSSTAVRCPKCNSEYPHGIYCRVCNPSSNRFLSDSRPFSVNQALTKGPHFSLAGYHVECVRRVLKVPDDAACADCGMPIAKLWDWDKLFVTKNLDGPCPECGRPYLLSGLVSMQQVNCCGCDLPILLWHKRALADRNLDYPFADADYLFADRSLYHDFCLAALRALVEKHESRIESRKSERDVVSEKSQQGCLSLLLIGTLITLLLTFSAFLMRHALAGNAVTTSGGLRSERGLTLHSSRPRAVRRPAASAARPARRLALRLWRVKARGG